MPRASPRSRVASPDSSARSACACRSSRTDRSLALADFTCGANRADAHLTGVNWGRDLPEPAVADLRNVVDGDAAPDGRGRLTVARGIEVGHIFQLGRKYSEAMGATVLDEQGRNIAMYMGCYGIGVTRIVAAAIEQNHDEHGIVWPAPLAPFQVVLVALNWAKSERVRDASELLYRDLMRAGIEVLLDDRDARPGVKFADAELVGIPHRVVVSERGLDAGRLEYRHRRASRERRDPDGAGRGIRRLAARGGTLRRWPAMARTAYLAALAARGHRGGAACNARTASAIPDCARSSRRRSAASPASRTSTTTSSGTR